MRRGKGGRHGLLPNSLRIISSCLKTVSDNTRTVASTVRSAGATVAASIAVPAEEERDQVLWAGFDKLDLGSASFKHVLLLGYANGFQVLDVEDASNVCELVSKRDGPVTFLQIQPTPANSEDCEGYRTSQPLLLAVAGDETNGTGMVQGGRLSALIRESASEPQSGNCIPTPTVVRFFSLKSHSYVHVLRFRSAVYIVRCSPRIVAVALAAQIYCFDALTLENKFSVLMYPLQGAVGVNIGYGPMAVGPRWLAYASNNPLLSNMGRLSPQNLTPSPGVSPSTSPGSGTLVARYAMESSKHFAAGILNLGDKGYKTLSKYCQELLPDGSNSPLSNSGRKSGKLPTGHPSEGDNAGMVVIKDFVSREVISQFRAHTSPISALCFDPSGTLLVTASVHGHNINVFRIMPTLIPNGSNSARYEWTSSHVHLYKLYRGLTTAVIQDICFSHFSQWVAIVSSKGTCHIFMLSPFGGDASLQPQSLCSDGPILIPNLSLPWWSTMSCVMDQQLRLPPPPITLSVVSRIKNGNSGWLNTVSNVAASATGKVPLPSGAIAAIFHNSIYHNIQPANMKASSLEHILVYSPSGHVIQYELVPSLGVETCQSNSQAEPAHLLQIPDDELHVNAEPVQWWDVCRRSNWPEREENIFRVMLGKQQNVETVTDISNCEDSGTSYSESSTNSMSWKELVKPQERPHWYLSNAEVQINSGRVPIWQKSKICFCMLTTSVASGGYANNCGEIEIEKFPIHEVERRRKDLLPAFEQFHYFQSDGNDRVLAGGRYQAYSIETNEARDKFINDPIFRHSKIAFSTSGADVGPCVPVSLQSLENPVSNDSIQNSTLIAHCEIEDESMGTILAENEMNASTRMPGVYSDKDCKLFQSKNTNTLMDNSLVNCISSSKNSLSRADKLLIKETLSTNNGLSSEVSDARDKLLIKETLSTNNGLSSEVSDARDKLLIKEILLTNNGLSSEVSDACLTNMHSEQTETDDSHNSLEFTQYFQDGYCKVSELDDCHELSGAVTDADSSSSHCDRERTEEDGDNDEMLGGVFAFCEG